MTSPQRSLHPASGDDRKTFPSAFELVARGRMQLAQMAGAVVGQSMTFEPRPQIFDRVRIRRAGRQEGDLDVLRAKAVGFKNGEVAARDKFLSNTGGLGKLAGIPVVTQTVNAVNATPVVRGATIFPNSSNARIAGCRFVLTHRVDVSAAMLCGVPFGVVVPKRPRMPLKSFEA